MLTAIAAPFLILLFILSIPIMLPFVAIAEKRTAKRKHALVATWPCGWCVAPLEPEALVRADALFAAYANEAFAEFDMPQPRMIKSLHACCPRCGAGHRYDERSNRFVLFHPAEFRDMFGKLMPNVGPPATAIMAWPWLASPGPMHQVTLTRDSVCLADDIDAPHRGMVAVPATMDVAAIAEALLRSPWLAHAGNDATWWCSIGPVTLIFGLSAGNPFVQRIGDSAFLATVVTNLNVHYSAQRDRDEICRDIAEYGAAALPRNGTSLSPGD